MYITVTPVTTTETAAQNSIENPAPVTVTEQTRVKSYGSNLRVLSISESSDFQSNTKSENDIVYRHGSHQLNSFLNCFGEPLVFQSIM